MLMTKRQTVTSLGTLGAQNYKKMKRFRNPIMTKSDITKRFTFELRLEDSLTIDDIWPDGDAPENPTAQDVLNKLKESGGDPLIALSEWNMGSEAVLNIIKASDWDDRTEWY